MESAQDKGTEPPFSFSKIARWTSQKAGQPGTFISSIAVIILWACSGPLFHYSDTWQLIINTGTTIITFLMVFLIQNSQNRDTIAIHLKLDELIRSIKEARNSVISLEEQTEEDLMKLQDQYRQLANNPELTESNSDVTVVKARAERTPPPAS